MSALRPCKRWAPLFVCDFCRFRNNWIGGLIISEGEKNVALGRGSRPTAQMKYCGAIFIFLCDRVFLGALRPSTAAPSTHLRRSTYVSSIECIACFVSTGHSCCYASKTAKDRASHPPYCASFSRHAEANSKPNSPKSYGGMPECGCNEPQSRERHMEHVYNYATPKHERQGKHCRKCDTFSATPKAELMALTLNVWECVEGEKERLEEFIAIFD